MTEYSDEEGLILSMKTSELCLEISNLTWNWDNFSEPVNEGHELMEKIRKLSVQISEYEEKANLNSYHKNKITNGIKDLKTLLPYMKNKMTSIKVRL